MAEPQKQQMGDGSDNIGQAAGQAAKAAKNAGKQAAKQAAKKGAEAAANAAAATVKAGVEGGKAVAEIAAGTAAGGPWGAIISAAWAMRHTLFKILVCLCLSVAFLIVMIVELPGIIINKALGLDGNEPTVSITEIYENLSDTVSDARFWTTRAKIYIEDYALFGPGVTIITGDHRKDIIARTSSVSTS